MWCPYWSASGFRDEANAHHIGNIVQARASPIAAHIPARERARFAACVAGRCCILRSCLERSISAVRHTWKGVLRTSLPLSSRLLGNITVRNPEEARMETRRVGRTGHESTVVTLGAFAFGVLDQDGADGLIEAALGRWLQQSDVASSYADAEIRLGNYLKRNPLPDVFISCKTQQRN